MKLVASVIVKNELHRYLPESLAALLEFCDEVRVLDDGSTDGWIDTLGPQLGSAASARVRVRRRDDSVFYEHEGRARQTLLDWTLEGEPTHILSIDADEFITDPVAVRHACTDPTFAVWAFCMQEVWNASRDGLMLRQDGGWAEHDVSILYRPQRIQPPLRMADRALACGRVPESVAGTAGGHSGSAILHFGWANRAERAARHDRYVTHDGGQFHNLAHLDSILLPDDELEFTTVAWPAAFTQARVDAILDRVGPAPDPAVIPAVPPEPGPAVVALPGFRGVSDDAFGSGDGER